MRVGLVTTSYPRFDGDIAGIFVRGFARALVNLGHTVDVLAPEPSTGEPDVSDEGVELTWVPYARPRVLERTFYGAGAPDNFTRDPLAILGAAPFVASLYAAVKRRAPKWDAVVSHWALPSALVCGRACKEIPHLAVMHSGDVHALSRLPFRNAMKRDIVERASTLWFVSTQLREEFGDTASKRVVIQPMGVERARMLNEKRESIRARLGFTRFTALVLSRLVPIKGVDVAIRAARECTDIDLVIAGDGPERADLEKLSAGRTRFLGEVAHDAKYDLLGAADVLLCPSRTLASGRAEGVPTSILEAMSYGLPIIATESGGIADVLQHERQGLLINADDTHALASAMQRLATDRLLAQRLGKNARESASAHTWDALLPTIRSALLR